LLPLRGVDEIWVPSKHNKNAYAKAGIDPRKIKVIPHGADIGIYNPEVKPLEYNRGEFNFGSVFDWTERKNPIALIRAYYNAFYQGENVSLTIRTFWRFPMEKTREYITAEVDKIKKGYVGRTDFPKILFWFDTMDARIMPNFYKSFDCFVLPTRGEGFGLPFLEAMACGVPSIGPRWGGNTEFMNDNNSILIDGKVEPINNHQFLRLQPQYAGQRWFNIDEIELSKSMRWVYDNPKDAKSMAGRAVKDIQSNWTWDHTANKIHKRLIELKSILEKSAIIK
jgi:glycosyltransferase involved in cell wall biosynthesis